MRGSQFKLVVSLALLTVAAVLMCLGIRWLFFIGLALVGLSGFICWVGLGRGSWASGVVYWLVGIGLLSWLSSFGRDPLPVWGACVGVISVCIAEVQAWRARRKATGNA